LAFLQIVFVLHYQQLPLADFSSESAVDIPPSSSIRRPQPWHSQALMVNTVATTVSVDPSPWSFFAPVMAGC
jgi:hypothetical protein